MPDSASTSALLGVIAPAAVEPAVREFFELFKTPWEPYQSGRQYQAVLCAAGAPLDDVAAQLLLVYSSEKTEFDAAHGIHLHAPHQNELLSFGEDRLPLYGRSVTFAHPGATVLVEESSGHPAGCVVRSAGQTFARVGYDLFSEVRALLTRGQPPANAAIPALELHIALLRRLITGCGLPLLEIPPVPEGRALIACLTHDVDHPSIRRHMFDPTMFGFLLRATLGSVVDAARGRMPLRRVFTNWSAAARLPFVYLGLARDFWDQFDAYLQMENGRPSTFFVLPVAGDPGRTAQGPAPRARASGYGVADIAGNIQRLQSAGCEIGLHGIDAWMDSARGREEAAHITGITQTADLGVRMHWLYWNDDSPAVLEAAGFDYDSTIGYNETVGFRAGATQAFQPLNATRLLELPLQVMDTALFYPSYLHLTTREAQDRIRMIADQVVRFGGALTVNWHDRSIAPERLWDEPYVRFLADLQEREAWCATAAQAVAWFRRRRSAAFQIVQWEPGGLRVHVTSDAGQDLPGLRLRIHKPCPVPAQGLAAPGDFMDIGFQHSVDTRIAL